jgi:Raffinose synthase or seed imbibition protein Sip1
VNEDWDMFQTSVRGVGSFHAAARCISGGPIFITDSPGQHDIQLIKQMTARSPLYGSSTGPLHCLTPRRDGEACEFFSGYTSKRLLRLISSHAHEQIIFMSLFNVSTETIQEISDPSECYQNDERSGYVLHGFRSGRLEEFPDSHASKHLLQVTLRPLEWEILCFVGTFTFKDDYNRQYRMAPLGLVGKMTGAAAVQSWKETRKNDPFNVSISIRAIGTLSECATRAYPVSCD